ncbi:MAG: hypothetical protein ACUVWN_02135 [bacterium]
MQKGESYIIITDFSGLGPSVKISFYDEIGHEVSVINKLIPPQGKIQANIRDYLKSPGTIIVESPVDHIVGEYWQVNKNGTIFMLPFQHSIKEERYLVNCMHFPSCEQNFIVISDSGGSGPMVQMEFYGRTGELIKVTRKLLRPYGMLIAKSSDYAEKDVLGKVSVRSFGGTITVHSRYITKKKATFALPARVPLREAIINRFSTGKNKVSILMIGDASGKGTDVNIAFLNRKGIIIKNISVTLPSSGSVTINLLELLGEVGNGIIKINSNHKIITDYWEDDPNNNYSILDRSYLLSELSSVQTIKFSSLSYFQLHDNIDISLFLLNIGKEILKIDVQFYTSDGKRVGNKRLVLSPYEFYEQLIRQNFYGLHLGTIVIKEPNPNLIINANIYDSKNNKFLGKISPIWLLNGNS